VWKRLSTTALVLLSFAAGVTFGALAQKSYSVMPLQSTPSPTPGESINFDVLEEFRGKLSLFILAGQSNISGTAEVPSNQSVDSGRIFVFGNDYHWKIAAEPIDNPIGQVDKISLDRDAGFGPGLAFASALLKFNPNMAIGLIPCAKFASSIEEWQRNLSDNTLYGSCLKRARAATPMGQIAGLLFFQGEADAVDPNQSKGQPVSAFDYGNKFTTFVNDFRKDVSLPSLPVVFAQIGTNTAPEHFVNWNIVKEQQASVKLPCSAMISTDDLPLKDVVHFTPESYQKIGERFAETFWNLVTHRQSCR
jgi:hypothetical protein